MSKYSHMFVSALLLVLLAVGLSSWSRSYQGSVNTYASPLVDLSLPQGDPLPGQTHRVVVILLSGMSYETAITADMPILQTLRKAGAYAPIKCRPPTLWQTAWASLITGAPPTATGMSLLDVEPDEASPLRLDTLFSAARDAGQRTAVVGSTRWQRLLPADTVDMLHLVAGDDVQADADVVQMALGLIGDPQYSLILIHLSQLEGSARTGGVTGPDYIGATRQIDSHLRQIVRQVNLSNSVLIVTSDVGLRADGQPAGAAAQPPDLPLVMVGKDVRAGAFSAITQADLAPTVALLLGVRMPAAAQGEILYQFLSLSADDNVLSHLRMAAQRVTLEERLAISLDHPEAAAQSLEDLLTARDAWLRGNSAGAVELSNLVIREATEGINQIMAVELKSERRARLPLTLAAVLAPLLLAWVRRLQRRVLLVASALLSMAVFYGLYRLLGYSFVFSDTLGLPGTLPVGAARNAVIGLAAGGLLLLASLLGGEQRRLHQSVATAYDYALVAVYVAALPLFFLYWQYGGLLHWHLPPAWVVIVLGLALKQTATVAVAGVVLPWLLGGAVWAVGKWRARARPTNQKWDPIAYLRR